MRPLVCVALFILLCTSTSVRGVGVKISCQECTDFVDMLDDVIDPNSPIDVIEAVADAFCLLTKAAPLDVCLGIVHEFAPIFKYVFSQKPVAEAVCAELRYCTPFAEEPDDHERVQDAFFLRRALQRKLARIGAQATLRNKAAVHETSRVAPLAQLKKVADPTVGYAFHISDMHYDPNYIAGTSVDCGYPLCCHGGVGDSQPFGSYGCDTPLALLHSTFTAMAKVLPDPDYIIFTGDVPPHNVWNQTTAYNLNASIESSGVLYQYFPKAQVLYALGNHEVFPVDQDNGPGNNTWFTSGLRPLWLPWLSESDSATWSYAAYYTTLLSPGHRLVSLDTNYCIVQNFYLVLSSVNDAYYDLGQQLKWLNTTLAAARVAQEHVWVLGHVPIGGWDCVDWYSNALYDVISAYPDVVSSAFMGHTHMDQLHVMRSNDSARTPLVPVYVSPAITPENGNNPTFRIYEFNRTTGELLDYTQYIGNLSDTDANGPAWQILYTAKNFFSIPDLSAASWADFAYRAINSTAVLQDYCNIWFTGRGAELGCADPGTLRNIACQFFSKNVAEQLSCFQTGPQ